MITKGFFCPIWMETMLLCKQNCAGGGTVQFNLGDLTPEYI
jgi:hypothetical protein